MPDICAASLQRGRFCDGYEHHDDVVADRGRGAAGCRFLPGVRPGERRARRTRRCRVCRRCAGRGARCARGLARLGGSAGSSGRSSLSRRSPGSRPTPRSGPSSRARERQDPDGSDHRLSGHGRPLPQCGGHRREPRRREHRGAAVQDDDRPCPGGRRDDHLPVQLAARDSRREPSVRARGGQHRRREAPAHDADLARAGVAPHRPGAAAGCPERRDRCRRRRRPRRRRRSAREARLLHRQRGRREAHHGDGRRESHERDTRARWQRSRDRPGRRGVRRGGIRPVSPPPRS